MAAGGQNGRSGSRPGNRRPRLRVHRTRQNIIIDILEASLTLKKKMRIMYKANLNYEQFTRHFMELRQKGFIEEMDGSDGKPSYRISDKGRTLLGAHREAEDIFHSENQ